MSLSRVRNAATLASLALFAACSDVVAPVVTKIQEVAARMDNLLTCTNTWATANSGLWSTASNWSAGHVPTSSEDVCITLEGSYTVTLRGVYSVNSLTIGTPGITNKPKLAVEGFWSAFNFQEVLSRLTVANGIDNYGWMELTSSGGTSAGGAQLFVTGGTFYNHDISSFRSLVGAGAGAGRYVQGTVINDGTMAFEAPTRGTGSFTNNALFTIVTGGSLSLSSGTFIQASGTFDIAGGSYFQNPGEFRINGGAMTGSAPVLQGVALQIGDESVPATVILRGANTLAGNVGANQVLQIEGWQLAAGWTETAGSLTSAAGFTNAGIIRLTSSGGPMNGSANLTGPVSAAIVNTGRIEVLVGVGNVRSINASIDNRAGGVVELQQNTSFGLAGATLTNAGTWRVATGKLQYMQGNSMKFIQNAGTLELDGASYQHTGAAEFQMNGGAITGEPWIQGTLRIGAGSTATGRILLTATNALVGDVMPGQTVTLAAYPNTNSTLTSAASFTNHGTIVLSATGSNTGTALLGVANNGTITNAADGRIETYVGSSATSRYISGNFVNDGTLHVTTLTFLLGPTIHTSGPITGGGELRNWGGTMFATGNVQANLLNSGAFHVGQAIGSAGQVNITGYFYMYSGSLNVDIAGSVPGTDFDKITASNWALSAGTLNVATTMGGCAGGGSSYEIIKAGSHSGDFAVKNGLNLGGGRTVTTVPGTTNYVLNVGGPVCVPPDVTPPVIAPTVSGTLGTNGWYTSDVAVTWSVTDAESAVASTSGCDATTLTSDNAGITYTCSATSAGGSATQSVTVKRDATAPVVSASRAPDANADGWNNTDVTASWSASDAMSGLAGSGTATDLFSLEGANQGGSHTFTDLAGNSASASVSGINIDKTAPVVTVTRSPAAGADGWNETSVTVTYSATDALSGIAGAATYSEVFGLGENQGGSHTFMDRAGNSATGTISDINVRTPPPPPPPTGENAIGSASPGEIWPANNKMVAVRVTMCTGVTSFTLRSVTNNETGNADVEGWAIGTADLNGSVRATRNGNGRGRTYTLVYDTISANGAAGTCTVTVAVPHDQGAKR